MERALITPSLVLLSSSTQRLRTSTTTYSKRSNPIEQFLRLHIRIFVRVLEEAVYDRRGRRMSSSGAAERAVLELILLWVLLVDALLETWIFIHIPISED